MKQKKVWLTYLAVAAGAVAVALMAISFEISNYGSETVLLMHFISDGCFTAAVFCLGCGILMLIAELGGFYGLQYLGYTMLCLFSFRKERLQNKKDYFTYSMEKKAKQKERGKSHLKWALLIVGLVCLALSALFAVIFYQMAS
ncbi:MAG: DUF3899 domain-containing protein [Oscillospiraceae bacterium]